ncbi:MAG: M67 family metallopeptidase [Candidatus Dormibacteria bacterium]
MSVLAVRLAASADATIRRLAEAVYPHEGCGVLIGAYEGDAVAVQEATSARNLWTQRLADRYDMDPGDIQAADRGARARGLDVVGFWHSHPDHPAHPSQFDSDRSWADYAYLIVSTVAGGSGDLNAFGRDDSGSGGLQPIALQLEAAPA